MKIISTLFAVFLCGCASIPTTNVYRQSIGSVDRILYILPVLDETPELAVTQEGLKNLRQSLVQSLSASGHFKSVQAVESVSPAQVEGATYVRLRVSQFDVSAKRMVAITELRVGTASPFVRLVTEVTSVSLELISGYIGVLDRIGSTAIDEITKHIVSLKDGK